MTAQLTVKWDPKNLEIKTRSVERQLRPLVIHVTTLVKSETPRKKKGKLKSMDAIVLVTAVERAIKNFIEKGEQIANENPDFSKEMLAAVEEVRTTGKYLLPTITRGQFGHKFDFGFIWDSRPYF